MLWDLSKIINLLSGSMTQINELYSKISLNKAQLSVSTELFRDNIFVDLITNPRTLNDIVYI